MYVCLSVYVYVCRCKLHENLYIYVCLYVCMYMCIYACSFLVHLCMYDNIKICTYV